MSYISLYWKRYTKRNANLYVIHSFQSLPGIRTVSGWAEGRGLGRGPSSRCRRASNNRGRRGVTACWTALETGNRRLCQFSGAMSAPVSSHHLIASGMRHTRPIAFIPDTTCSINVDLKSQHAQLPGETMVGRTRKRLLVYRRAASTGIYTSDPNPGPPTWRWVGLLPNRPYPRSIRRSVLTDLGLS